MDSGSLPAGHSRVDSIPHLHEGSSILEGTRILAFCDYFAPGSSGGSERVALEVYTRLVHRGAEITVITIGKSSKPSVQNVNGITVHEIPLLDLSRILRAQVAVAPALFRYAPTISRDFAPHLLHANNIYFQTTLAAALFQRRLGVPLVTTAHLGSLGHLSQPIRSLTAGYELTVGRYILRRSSKVIAVSESVQQHLFGLGARREKVELVFNGVDSERFRPARPSEFPDQDSRPLVVFIGRLIGNKGPDVLLDALYQLHREKVVFRALIIGDGPLRPLLERRVVEHRMTAIVKFTGHLDDVASHLRSAALLVRPSLSEGMPLTVLEAMASRVGVVASDIPGNRDLIRNGENGILVPTANVTSLAEAIRRMLENSDLRGRLALAGYQTSHRYSWDSTADGTASVLASVR